jgi:hypothetical protein
MTLGPPNADKFGNRDERLHHSPRKPAIVLRQLTIEEEGIVEDGLTIARRAPAPPVYPHTDTADIIDAMHETNSTIVDMSTSDVHHPTTPRTTPTQRRRPRLHPQTRGPKPNTTHPLRPRTRGRKTATKTGHPRRDNASNRLPLRRQAHQPHTTVLHAAQRTTQPYRRPNAQVRL